MSLLVVGSVAYDVVETPFGKCDKMLGGSASHFSISASFFTDVSIVAVVGGDFTDFDVFEKHRIGTRDLERIEDGKTFRWGGKYEYDLNVAHTLFTDLNVFADFQPKLSEESKRSRLLFLGNIQPDLQRGVREQMPDAELVALDTMNLWIEHTRESLERTIRVVDVVIINDAEARQLTGIPNLIKAAREILSWGPKALIIKRGEYGAALFTANNYFAIPALTTERIPFCTKMSLTISASAGEPSLCSDTKRASLLSRPVISSVNCSTSSVLSSGQTVIPASYSDSHVGQNIIAPPAS